MGSVNRPALRAFRELKGWTTREIASRAGINNGNYAKIENGTNLHPRPETIVSLANAIGVDVTAITLPHAACPDCAGLKQAS